MTGRQAGSTQAGQTRFPEALLHVGASAVLRLLLTAKPLSMKMRLDGASHPRQRTGHYAILMALITDVTGTQ